MPQTCCYCQKKNSTLGTLILCNGFQENNGTWTGCIIPEQEFCHKQCFRSFAEDKCGYTGELLEMLNATQELPVAACKHCMKEHSHMRCGGVQAGTCTDRTKAKTRCVKCGAPCHYDTQCSQNTGHG